MSCAFQYTPLILLSFLWGAVRFKRKLQSRLRPSALDSIQWTLSLRCWTYRTFVDTQPGAPCLLEGAGLTSAK